MNQRLKETLDGYEDFELAFLYRFKIETYMKGTRETVTKYIRERGLTDTKIDTLISETENMEFEGRAIRCPRCRTAKIRVEQVESDNPNYRSIATIDAMAGKSTSVDQVICNVCGIWLNDPNNQAPSDYDSFWDKLRRRFKR